MSTNQARPASWLFKLKRKILLGLLGILTLSILATVVFSVTLLRSHLLENSRQRATELNHSITASLRQLMLLGQPQVLQKALEGLRSDRELSNLFIIDRQGQVAYASNPALLGKVMDRRHDPTCTCCHKNSNPPDSATIVLQTPGGEVQRNISVIPNEPACHTCHGASQAINGKLFIDRSLQRTDRLILKISLLIAGSGLVGILVLTFFLGRILSRGLDQYISEILRQNNELSILFMMIDRLTSTIDIEELKQIVLTLFRDVFAPDEVSLVMRKEARELRCSAWNAGDQSIQRQKLAADSELARAVSAWTGGMPLPETTAATGAATLYVPIGQNDQQLALVRLTRKAGSFDAQALKLLPAIASHVAVALENSRLYFLAITDELTHLYTPRHFRYCLGQALAAREDGEEGFTLLMIDIDDFKAVNDRYGHPVGDTVLAGMARCLLDSMRDNDLPFRYGGEEFAVLLPGTDCADALQVAERIRADIAATCFDPEGTRLHLTASIGVACCPHHAENARDLVSIADQALYRAKHSGKNRVMSPTSKGD